MASQFSTLDDVQWLMAYGAGGSDDDRHVDGWIDLTEAPPLEAAVRAAVDRCRELGSAIELRLEHRDIEWSNAMEFGLVIYVCKGEVEDTVALTLAGFREDSDGRFWVKIIARWTVADPHPVWREDGGVGTWLLGRR